MLPRPQRMTRGEEFRSAVRTGVRAAQPALVAHVVPAIVDGSATGPTRVGFVVSKAVGNAADRNRVKRQLRHLMRDRLDVVPRGSRIVIRALPSASGQTSASLGQQLDAALRRGGA